MVSRRSVAGPGRFAIQLEDPFVVEDELHRDDEPVAVPAGLERRRPPVDAGAREGSCRQERFQDEAQRHRAALLLQTEDVTGTLATVAECDRRIADTEVASLEAVPLGWNARAKHQPVPRSIRRGTQELVNEQQERGGRVHAREARSPTTAGRAGSSDGVS